MVVYGACTVFAFEAGALAIMSITSINQIRQPIGANHKMEGMLCPRIISLTCQKEGRCLAVLLY